MSIRNFRFWNAAPVTQTVPVPQSNADEPDALGNVVQLPLGSPVDVPAGLASKTTESAQPDTHSAHTINTSASLMAASELQAFFASNFVGLGRHNGSHYKTQDAQTQGKATLVSQFQNAVAAVISQKQAKVDGLRNMELQTEGVCNTATGQPC